MSKKEGETNSHPLTVELLQGGRKILSDPARWTSKAYARDEKGEPVDPVDPEACTFCAMGALDRSRADLEPDHGSSPCYLAMNKAALLLRRAAQAEGWTSVIKRAGVAHDS